MKPDITIKPKDCPIITYYQNWLAHQDIEFDEDVDWPVEGDLVTNILTLDFTHWLMRHISGGAIDDAHIDTIRDMRGRAIAEYRKVMEKDYLDVNGAKIWGDD